MEYPEIRSFVNTIDNVIKVVPKYTFAKVCSEYGVPLISKEQAQYIRQYKTCKSEKTKETRLNGNKWGMGKISKKWLFLVSVPYKISEQCCDKLKKDPIKKYEKLTGQVPFIGNMAEESFQRKESYLKYGCNAFEAKRPISRPLGFWTEQDILEYLYVNKLNYASIYGEIVKKDLRFILTGAQRTGCAGCMFGVQKDSNPNRFQRMKITHPKMWNYFINDLNFKQYLEDINVKYE